MFYCNNDDNGYYIPADTLRIELKAGGLSKAQENYIINSMQPNGENLVCFCLIFKSVLTTKNLQYRIIKFLYTMLLLLASHCLSQSMTTSIPWV